METSLLVAGFTGGVIRGLVGFVKYQYSYKNVGFKPAYFLTMIVISGVIGLGAGWLASGVLDEVAGSDIRFYAFLAGYAGGDFIENVYKIVSKKPSLYNLPELKK